MTGMGRVPAQYGPESIAPPARAVEQHNGAIADELVPDELVVESRDFLDELIADAKEVDDLRSERDAARWELGEAITERDILAAQRAEFLEQRNDLLELVDELEGRLDGIGGRLSEVEDERDTARMLLSQARNELANALAELATARAAASGGGPL